MAKIHEAVCAAAGWQAYCDRCRGEMRRARGYSYCPNEACSNADARERVKEWNYWEESPEDTHDG